MEFHHLGKHCAVPHCKQLDFLPFKCSGCSEIFCLDHRTYSSHGCSKQNEHDRRAMVCPICNVPIVSLPQQDPNIVLDDHINQGCVVKASAGYKCNMQGCKKVDVVPIVCKLCRRHHCVRHRFESDHKCPRKPQKPAISQKQPNNNNNNNNNIKNNNNNNNFSNANVYPGTVTTTRNQNNNYPSNSYAHNNNNNNNNNSRNISNNRAPPVSHSSYNPNQYSESTIGVRLTNGEMLRQIFNSNTTLREVQSFIEQNRTDGSAPYVMRTTYPPRELSFTDLDKTLAQLGLVPSGVIILQNYQIDGSQPQSQSAIADPNANVGWWGTISSFVSSFIPQ